jgi:hypothetical protein
MLSNSALKQRWWMHRDQKTYDPKRDANHLKTNPSAFSMEHCYQSSLYLHDSTDHESDSFICCPGSHIWEDTEEYTSSPDRHHVSVPYMDQRVIDTVSKLIIYSGEMIIWDSRLAHMGGYISKPRKNTNGLEVKMLRLEPIDHDNFQKIKDELEQNGFCIVKGVISPDEIRRLKDQLKNDISKIYNLPEANDWSEYPDDCYGRTNKGGGSWGPIACSKAAWESRILPRRVEIFKNLLNSNDLVVSLDSVHWNVKHKRLSFMASFSPRHLRSNDAYKRKCISQAYGMTRTTHWAHLGDISKFNFGSERNSMPHKRFQAVSREWKGHGSLVTMPESLREVYAKALSQNISNVSKTITIDEATELLEPDVSRWL